MTMKKVSYIGIYYYIYLYEWADLSIKQRILKSIIFWKMAITSQSRKYVFVMIHLLLHFLIVNIRQ